MRTRLTPPPENAATLGRRRLDQHLAEAAEHRLTVLAAPAGTGKTVALAELAYHGGWPTVWCRLRAEDSVEELLQHLAVSFQRQGLLDEHSVTELTLVTLVNILETTLNDDTLLILDDYHLIDTQPLLITLVEALIDNLPKRLHLILSGRCTPHIKQLSTLLVRGEALIISQADLAFRRDEAEALFTHNGKAVPANLDVLLACSRGWPLVLQALCRAPELTGDMHTALPLQESDRCVDFFANVIDQIYAYFKQEIFDQQSDEVSTFLLETALLQNLYEVRYLYGPEKGEQVIQLLQQKQFFVEHTNDGQPAYQPLFHAFLFETAQYVLGAQQQLIHRRLAEQFKQINQIDKALQHLLAAGDSAQAAALLTKHASFFFEHNRATDLLLWIQNLPHKEQSQPDLLLTVGEGERRLLRFASAQQHYIQAYKAYLEIEDPAGQARALRGQALVFLDTVNPAAALPLLKQALKRMPPLFQQERVEIVRLQSENWINAGRTDVALLLEKAARRLSQETGLDADATDLLYGRTELPPRLLLRTGHLQEARAYLERELGFDNDAQPVSHTPGLHREPSLLLALIDVMLGNNARAMALARRSLLDAQQREFHLMEAIAHMRLGHAMLLMAPREATAQQHYEHALELTLAEGISRTSAEAYLGLTLLYGHDNDLTAAEEAARAGLHIAMKAGDTWTAALLWLALGGAAAAHKDERALEWLERAEQRFQQSGDNYGQAVVALWRTISYEHAKQLQAAQQASVRLFELIEQGGYSGLLSGATLFGPRDQAMLVPILLRGRSAPLHGTSLGGMAEHILQHAFSAIAHDEQVERYYPGFTLRVQLLGDFRIWRGSHEIQAREWQRDKSRQLLQLLLTYRGQWVHREQLCAWLWPESDMAAAERQFKVTLNALNVALEPGRPPRTNPFFIRRQGLAYSFAPSSGCWIDVDEFELRLATIPHAEAEQAIRNGRIAVQLYKGDFLPELLYEPWTFEERERLLARYLSATIALAAQLLENGDNINEIFTLCEQVLRRDRCYEEAYQLLMRAYARSGSRSQALRVYARCERVLREEMDIEPLPETSELAERIKHDLPV